MADPAPWTAQRVVSQQQAKSLIASQFPQLAPVSVEPLGIGWDNTAYRVNDTLVFRFPRRDMAVEILQHEINVLPLIGELVPLPVPVPLCIGTPSSEYPWPFVGAQFIQGTMGCSANLTKQQRIAMAPALGRFLRALHDIDTHAARQCKAPLDQLGRLDIPKRTTQIRQRLQEAMDQGFMSDATSCNGIIDAVPIDWQPRTDVLVHGDLYLRHVLVDDAAMPSGIIDWGDVHLGDAAVDLALIAGSIPRDGHTAFEHAYGEVDDSTWRVARFKALHLALAILVFGHDAGDDALMCEARFILDNVAR